MMGEKAERLNELMGELLSLQDIREEQAKRDLERVFNREPHGSLDEALISILTTRGNVHHVPLEAVIYIGKVEGSKDWEVRFLAPDQEEVVTAHTTATDVILLLLKLAKLVGIDVQSNIA